MKIKTILIQEEILLQKHKGLFIPQKKTISFLQELIAYDYEVFLIDEKKVEDNLLLTFLANEGIPFKKTTLSSLASSSFDLENTYCFAFSNAGVGPLLPSKNIFLFNKKTKWDNILAKIKKVVYPPRKITHGRKTKETQISLTLNLDGQGKNRIQTSIGFFDHMLDLLAKHANFDLTLKAKGDLVVDEHHTIEDVAITLGEALKKALGDKRGITRYAFSLPMDETASSVLLDISNRPFLKFKAKFKREKVGDFPTEMVEHFFYSFALAAGLTLHLKLQGENDHHQIEGAFKALAKCLEQAVSQKNTSLPSTKGVL